MSYDLFFAVKQGRPAPRESDVRRFFEGHRLYEVDGSAARYDNTATGSYFSFEWGEPVPDEDLDEHGLLPTGISFNINYARPHSFALEADIELAQFVEEFALSVNDPQTGGMGLGDYDSAGFQRGWAAGSKATLGILLSSMYDRGGKATDLNLLPFADIERFWKWNYLKPALEARRDWFVSEVLFLRDASGMMRSYAYWPDGLPTALPEVDAFVLVDTHTEKRVLVPAADLTPVFERGRWSEDVTRHLAIDDETALQLSRQLLEAGEAMAGPLAMVPPDEILDLDWVKEVLARMRDEA